MTKKPEDADAFTALDHRLMSIMSRLQCVVENFGDYTGMENELHPAAFVLEETTEDVVQFYKDLQNWHFDHDHTPKPPEGECNREQPNRPPIQKASPRPTKHGLNSRPRFAALRGALFPRWRGGREWRVRRG